MTATFPEEAYYPWRAVERVKHDSDPAVLTYMGDRLDSWTTPLASAWEMGDRQNIRTAPCEIFIPYLVLVYDVE